MDNFISDYGAYIYIHSNNDHTEWSKYFLHILCKYNISSITTDPHHPQHNTTERRIQFYKKSTNIILDQTGATSYVWLYAFLL